MWRRVLSQSPTSVPTDAEDARRTAQYLAGWKTLGALIHSGRSLSGRERNCCFLNTGGSRFAEVSAAVGLDFDSDSRGLALVDWDADGDLDLWLANRTSPRVRYLQNGLDTGAHYLAVKLRGVTCNRDAIGAKVELILRSNSEQRLVRSVSAGEGFVSQSSKWLHFGLGDQTDIDRIVVRWPGGRAEEIRGLAADQRYEIVQGSGKAVLWNVAASSAPLEPSQLAKPVNPATRIVLSRRLPFPTPDTLALDGQPMPFVQPSGQPVLINLWATWCQPCLEELDAWKTHSRQLDDAGVWIVALNVELAADDAETDLQNIRSVWDRLELPFTCQLIGRRGLEVVEAVERVLTLKQGPLPIPTSFLLDGNGHLAVAYKGPLSAEQLIRDVQQLNAPLADVRDASVPFRGKWYTDASPPDLIAIPLQLISLGHGSDAFQYLQRHVISADDVRADAWSQFGATAQKVVGLLQGTAALLISEGKPSEAVTAYQWALRYDPESWRTHVELSSLLIRLGRSSEAITLNRRMTQLRKDHPLPWNNIAWILATSKEPQVRDATKAIEISERICRATKNQEPTALDTLAVAYAAAGRYDDARLAARHAIARAKALGQPKIVDRIQQHLQAFESDQPYQP